MKSRIVSFWRRQSLPRSRYCHRCGVVLQGVRGARYCVNCLWDELDDPLIVANERPEVKCA